MIKNKNWKEAFDRCNKYNEFNIEKTISGYYRLMTGDRIVHDDSALDIRDEDEAYRYYSNYISSGGLLITDKVGVKMLMDYFKDYKGEELLDDICYMVYRNVVDRIEASHCILEDEGNDWFEGAYPMFKQRFIKMVSVNDDDEFNDTEDKPIIINSSGDGIKVYEVQLGVNLHTESFIVYANDEYEALEFVTRFLDKTGNDVFYENEEDAEEYPSDYFHVNGHFIRIDRFHISQK